MDSSLNEQTSPNQTNSLFSTSKLALPAWLRISNRKQSVQSATPNLVGTAKWRVALLSVLGISCFILGTVGVFAYQTYQVINTVKHQASTLSVELRSTLDSVKNQDILAIEATLPKHREQVESLHAEIKKLSWYRHLPVAKEYYQDAEHAFSAVYAGFDATQKAIEALVPYADVLGLNQENAQEAQGETAEDRIQVILASLEAISPQLDAIAHDLERANQELSAIDSSRYPETFQGREIRSNIIQAQELSQLAISSLKEYRPVIELLPEIAGATGERKKYLILFQNDNELRPTGGFLTAYAIVYIENGKVVPEKSDDIYELDKKFRKQLPIPQALGRYLTTERYWNLRDMNISPDFKVSMDQFYGEYSQLPGEPDDIDGIIAVDTHFLTGLLEILGPVQVPGYGTFSVQEDSRCDCPQIIYALSEIITRPTPYLRADRKGILGPLMSTILSKAYEAPRQMNQPLFQLGINSIKQRHIQFYFIDETIQTATETIRAGGRLPNHVENDFLAIINANLGGAKSNLFVTYEVTQKIDAPPENGRLTKTVEITYKNPRKGDNCNLEAGLLCLNSTLRDWTRLYVPAGAELISAQGFTEEAKVYEEDGLSVIDGFFILEPLGTAKLIITYSIPYTNPDVYRVQLWKQGGIGEVPTLFDITGGQEKIILLEDMAYNTPF